jgi:hypothetical protein
MTPTEITAHLRLIETQLHELRSRIESAPELAPPLAFAKLSAPAGENYTSAASWRRHIQILHSALVKEFGRREFRVKELRAFLESRVELLPGDRELRPGHAVNQGLVWHKSVYDAIACRPCTWGDSGALIVYVSRDRWRVLARCSLTRPLSRAL